MSDEWKLGVVYVCPERDIECGSFERNWCANCPKRRATPPSPSTAPTEQNQAADLNVMPPFAAPAGQHDTSESRWINVDDRLPDDCTFVAIFDPENDELPVRTAYWLAGSQTFESEQGWLAKDEVSHWMPLPPAPIKKDEKV